MANTFTLAQIAKGRLANIKARMRTAERFGDEAEYLKLEQELFVAQARAVQLQE